MKVLATAALLTALGLSGCEKKLNPPETRPEIPPPTTPAVKPREPSKAEASDAPEMDVDVSASGDADTSSSNAKSAVDD